MSDNDQPSGGTGASSQPSGTDNAGLEAIVQKAVTAALAGVDSRFSGFQSLMDKKLATLSRQLKTSDGSDDPEGQLDDESESELETLKRELALYQFAEQYPNEVKLFKAVMGQGSLEEQLQAIRSFTATAEGAATPASDEPAGDGEADEPAPEVDGNNPARPKISLKGAIDSEEKADLILGQFAGRKGALHRLMGGRAGDQG